MGDLRKTKNQGNGRNFSRRVTKKFRSHFGSSGPLAQLVVVLFHFDHSLRFVLAFFSLFAPMLAQRRSQQTTQQTSLSMTRHSTLPLMSQFLTSRLMHKRRPFLLIAVTIQISGCAHVPSFWPRRQHRSRRHRRDCQFRRIY